jgi:hypothetical protein
MIFPAWRLHYCSASKEYSMPVSDCLVRHSEQSRSSSHEAPPPPPPQAWGQLSRPNKFPQLGEDFRKRKNKSHRREMTRTASTEGNFENSEEFILVDGRVTVDELQRNWPQPRFCTYSYSHRLAIQEPTRNNEISFSSPKLQCPLSTPTHLL